MTLDYVSWGIGAVGGLVGIWSVVSRTRLERDTEASRLWRDNAEAEKARADRFEQTITDLVARVERLESENRLLRSLVSGERAYAELASLVTDQHRETLAAVAALAGPRGPVERRQAPTGPTA